MLLPITHENMTSRRWPFVTLGLIVTCFAVFLATNVAMGQFRVEVEGAARDAITYLEQHPWLEPPPPLDRAVHARDLEAARHLARPPRGSDAPELIASQQAQLDALCARLREVIKSSPMRRFGYVPAEPDLRSLVTSQFMHGGWLHLIFNMWFLWLCGCNLEDRWGRAVFLPFYLLAGIAAALAYELMTPTGDAPLIGASGAIAGAMGAFLVAFANTRIRFFYFYLKFGTFTAPAYVMLPLWLVEQVVWGLVGAEGDNVAYWAHVGGFVFGVAVALVLRFTGIEKRLDDAVEATVSTSQDPRLARAGELIDQGQALAALAMLDALAGQRPLDIDVQLETLRGAKAASDGRRESRAYAKLIELYLRDGSTATALELYAEVQQLGIENTLPRAIRFRIADELSRAALPDLAAAAYASLCSEGIVDELSLRASVCAGTIAARRGRHNDARAMLQAARESPLSTPDLARYVDDELAQLPGA